MRTYIVIYSGKPVFPIRKHWDGSTITLADGRVHWTEYIKKVENQDPAYLYRFLESIKKVLTHNVITLQMNTVRWVINYDWIFVQFPIEHSTHSGFLVSRFIVEERDTLPLFNPYAKIWRLFNE